jgi:hypothetical protein
MAPRTARADADAADEALDLPPLPGRPLRAPEPPSDFLREDHGFVRVVYHPSLFEPVRRLVRDADAIRAELASDLGQSVLERVELRVGRTPDEMAFLAPAEAPIAARTTGAAFPPIGLVVLSRHDREGNPVGLDSVFRHELAHLALFDATAGRALPRWLQEGFAVRASDDRPLSRLQTLFGAYVHGRIAPFSRLESFPEDPRSLRTAYAQSADFVGFLAQTSHRDRWAASVAAVRAGAPLDDALRDAYGEDRRALEERWRTGLGRRFVTWPLVILAICGWIGLFVAGVLVARRRRARRVERETRILIAPDVGPLGAAEGDAARLLVCDRGLGHVVYIVEGRGVPKVEHGGKQHTLH